ncbi:MAG: HNH endonuclease [Acidobacteria bacterium]|nr:MAG: HNH endonuclease [Acidobacteriota bacterium]
MRYWWVNQNQTYKQELGGGYLWSLKRNANGARNPFYESMREVAPGDLVFSFVDTRIAAVGIAESYCYESPKPEEFGDAGLNWERIGWRIRVRFKSLSNLVRPKEHIELLRPLIADRYAPLQPNGNGIQSVYLTVVSEGFAEALIALIGPEAIAVQANAIQADRSMTVPNADLELWEHHIESEVDQDISIPLTDREAIITARRRQGLFKQRVMAIERFCRITRVDNPTHLRASHCKPWRDSTNDERLNGENGLLLTPSIDHLFDRGFISFQEDGQLIISPVADASSLERMGVPTRETVNVGAFSSGQRRFLEYHRDAVLLRAVR